jgi:hypothetical protein
VVVHDPPNHEVTFAGGRVTRRLPKAEWLSEGLPKGSVTKRLPHRKFTFTGSLLNRKVSRSLHKTECYLSGRRPKGYPNRKANRGLPMLNVARRLPKGMDVQNTAATYVDINVHVYSSMITMHCKRQADRRRPSCMTQQDEFKLCFFYQD